MGGRDFVWYNIGKEYMKNGNTSCQVCYIWDNVSEVIIFSDFREFLHTIAKYFIHA